MFAVIQTGGKQYLVEPNDAITVEKLPGEAGGKVVFDNVLFVADGKDVKVGAPEVEGASVEGEIIEQKRDKKVIVFKYHSKSRYRKKKGHRQPHTKVKIISIKTK